LTYISKEPDSDIHYFLTTLAVSLFLPPSPLPIFSYFRPAMARIHLTTFIAAPAEVVFDLSRHIGLHQLSMRQYGEEAIRGVRSGLIKAGESVTWKAKHLGKVRYLTVKITAMERPLFFEDVMTEGDFLSFHHTHHFKQVKNGTLVIEELEFESPYGLLGQLLNRFYLTLYMKRLLEQRNHTIREYAESKKWEALLR